MFSFAASEKKGSCVKGGGGAAARTPPCVVDFAAADRDRQCSNCPRAALHAEFIRLSRTSACARDALSATKPCYWLDHLVGSSHPLCWSRYGGGGSSSAIEKSEGNFGQRE